MVDTISTAVSVLVAVGALAVSLLAHRHQVGRARVLDARERRLEAAERSLAQRQEAADRQAVLSQASMIDFYVVWTPSVLVAGVTTPGLRIANLSSQPVSALSATIADEPVADVSGVLAAAGVRTFRLPIAAAAVDTSPGDLNVAFTDVAGNRWCRDGSGGLRQGSRTDTGTWTWGAREAPTVVQATLPPAPSGLPAPSGRACALACLFPAAALVVLAIAVWAVFFR